VQQREAATGNSKPNDWSHWLLILLFDCYASVGRRIRTRKALPNRGGPKKRREHAKKHGATQQ
ncbi:MAG: hypothetical protein VW644_07875, partial [Alphaproteobacteria bacterium]